MTIKLSIKVPGIENAIEATLLEGLDQNITKMVSDLLREPRRMTTDHTLSTGDYIIARGRPPVNPVQLGSQAAPLGKTEMLCRLKAGDILFPGGNDLHFAYGPDNTEPLMARGPVIAKVDDQCLGDFYRAGRLIWEAQYRLHEVVIIDVSSREVH